MKLIIKFNKKIYPLAVIKTSIKSFEPVAKFQIKNTKDYIIVILNKIQPNIKEVIKDEFSNYVLANINNI